MPKQPTAKTKRQRVSLDDYLWPIFIAACGGKCVSCGSEENLQRGHIQSYEGHGPTTLDNLQPLCAVCNGKHNKEFSMEDWRPGEWRANFIKLLAQNLRLELTITKGAHPTSKNGVGGDTLNVQNSLENTEVISWANANFRFNSVLRAPFPTHAHPYPLEEYLAIVEKLLRRGAQHAVSISPPDEKCRSKLCNLVKLLGGTDFMAAADEFLRQQNWFDEDNGYVRRVMREPWQTFADNTSLYLADASDRARRLAKQAAEERAAAVKSRAEQRDREAKERWLKYQSIRGMSWATMTDADREFIGEITGEPLTVSDADFARVEDIIKREWAHVKTTKRYALLAMFDRAAQLFIDKQLQLTSEQASEIGRLRKLVERASDNGPELEDYRQRLIACTQTKRKQEPEPESAEQPE